MSETGMRAGEVIGLAVPDVDLTRGMVTVRRGKGGKGRSRRSALNPPALWTDTFVRGALTGWPTPRRCGSVNAVRDLGVLRAAQHAQ